MTIPQFAESSDYQALYGDSNVDNFVLLAAQSAIQTFCGWQIGSDSKILKLDSEGQARLVLPALNVTAVSSVTLASDQTPITDFEWSDSGVLLRRCGWPRGLQAIQVAFVSGYTPLPEVITAVTCSIARRMVQEPGLTQESKFVGGIQRSRSFQQVPLLQAEKLALAPFAVNPV